MSSTKIGGGSPPAIYNDPKRPVVIVAGPNVPAVVVFTGGSRRTPIFGTISQPQKTKVLTFKMALPSFVQHLALRRIAG